MTDQKDSYVTHPELSMTASNLVGFYSAIFTAIIAVVTFGFAVAAIPISGANCPRDCAEYPYLDTVSQFPRDFLWMPLAIVLVLAYVTLMVCIYSYAPGQKKIYSQIGLCFALIAATLLVADYFIQFSAIPMSLKHAETEGLAMWIQYNPHGVFLALEELGYLVMSLSFLFMAPVFANRSHLESAVRWIFVIAFVLAIVALIWFSITYGLERQDRFEVAVLSIDWLVLIINGILLGIVFGRRLKEKGKVLQID